MISGPLERIYQKHRRHFLRSNGRLEKAMGVFTCRTAITVENTAH